MYEKMIWNSESIVLFITNIIMHDMSFVAGDVHYLSDFIGIAMMIWEILLATGVGMLIAFKSRNPMNIHLMKIYIMDLRTITQRLANNWITIIV